jgi:hypothetical protein
MRWRLMHLMVHKPCYLGITQGGVYGIRMPTVAARMAPVNVPGSQVR